MTTSSMAEELDRLDAQRQRGLLSDAEFERAKARLLGGGAAASAASPAQRLAALRRSAGDRWLGGVCGGIAEAIELPAWTVRLGFALLALASCGAGVLLYLLLWFFVPTA